MTVALFGVLRDFNILNVPLPQNARQIAQTVLRKGPVRGPFQFGFELGTGLRTYVTATVPYVLLVAVWLYGREYGFALLAGAGFGLGKAAMTLMRYWSRDGAQWDLRLTERLKWVIPISSLVATMAALLIMSRI